jgi:hypothetical protein
MPFLKLGKMVFPNKNRDAGTKLRKETTGYDGTTLVDVQSGKCYREKVHGGCSENQVIFTAQINVDRAQSLKKK